MSPESFGIRPAALEGAASWAERLRAAGLAATGPRLAVLAYLEKVHDHPSARTIYATLHPDYPSLSLSAVYETLDALVEAGICRVVAGEGALLRVDGTEEPHDHAVCRQCGRIFDVASSLWERPSPPTRLPGGLAVMGMRVEFEAICRVCARDASREPTPATSPDPAAQPSGVVRRSRTLRSRGDRRGGSDRRRGPERRRG